MNDSDNGTYSLDSWPALVEVFKQANFHPGEKGRKRHCYKGRTTVRALLVAVNEKGHMKQGGRFWKNLASAGYFNAAIEQSSYEALRFLAAEVLKPHYDIPAIQGIQIETELDE